MSTLTSDQISDRRRFVPLEFHALMDSGFFRPEERPWLCDGAIVDAVTSQRRRFTTDDLERMADLGFFDADGEDRVELIDGEILTMARVKPPHAWGISRLDTLLRRRLPESVRIRNQSPVVLAPTEEPQPDLAIVADHNHEYRHSHPTPADIHLVIEVMDSSTYRDRTKKLPKYAEAGIREVWLVNLLQSHVEVCRIPRGDQYLDRRILVPGLTLEIEALPEVSVEISDIFG